MHREQIKLGTDNITSSPVSSVVFTLPWVQEEMRKRIELAMHGSKK